MRYPLNLVLDNWEYLWFYWTFYRPKRSFGQGNIFTPVCHSVHRGGGVLLARPPPAWRTPPGWRTPWHGEPPQDGEPPHLDGDPPGWRTPPDGGIPPGWRSPQKQTPAYGLRLAGMHPTGMHSCCIVILDYGLKLHKLLIHTLVMLQKWQKYIKSLLEVPIAFYFLPYLLRKKFEKKFQHSH